MFSFCLRSVIRLYGWQFVRHVALPHPIRSARALFAASRIDDSGDEIAMPDVGPIQPLGGPRSIVGVGFCLKPLNPPCLSGRFNHRCHYLERLAPAGSADPPDCCKLCAIRRIGTMALDAGAGFYIMTSARDILFDVFLPALTEKRFASGLFVLCRYSLRPFAVGLLASGIRGRMFAFDAGSCMDYATWLLADRGIKRERTTLRDTNESKIRNLLEAAPSDPNRKLRFAARGNLLCPEPGALPAG